MLEYNKSLFMYLHFYSESTTKDFHQEYKTADLKGSVFI